MAKTMEWQVVGPGLLDVLPARPGVFEIGNLVRSVLFIGAAPSDLASSVRAALAEPRLVARSHCIRFELTDEPERHARERLAEYRRTHGGILPYAHRMDPLTTLLDARRPPSRALKMGRPGRKAGPATFLRAVPDL